MTPYNEMVPAVRTGASLEVVTADDFMPLLTVKQSQERKRMLNELILGVMNEGVDFGMQQGAPNKPKVLLKPGAEKMCSHFGLSPRIVEEYKVEDWTGADHGGEPFFYFKYTVALYRGSRYMGEAVGSCNSWESKYRYRWVREVPPPSFRSVSRSFSSRNLRLLGARRLASMASRRRIGSNSTMRSLMDQHARRAVSWAAKNTTVGKSGVWSIASQIPTLPIRSIRVRKWGTSAL